jgi:hypothetical protein
MQTNIMTSPIPTDPDGLWRATTVRNVLARGAGQ